MRSRYPWVRLASTLYGILFWTTTAVAVDDPGRVEIPSYRAEVARYFKVMRQDPAARYPSAGDQRIFDEFGRKLAAEKDSKGLQSDMFAPDFILPDAFGNPTRLYTLLEHGPVVLVFFRGSWCPFDTLYLRSLSRLQARLQTLGADLVLVTPQMPKISRKQIEGNGFGFKILSDLDSSVIKAYRLYYRMPDELRARYQEYYDVDFEEYYGMERFDMTRPATLIVDRDARIANAFVDADFRQRMEPKDIFRALEDLSQYGQ